MLTMLMAAALQVTSVPQTAPVPAPAARLETDPVALAAAERLLDIEGFEDAALRESEVNLELILAAMTEQLQRNSDDPIGETLLADMKTLMRDHSQKTLRDNMRSMKRQAATLYAQEFTTAELTRLADIAADPLMVKVRGRLKTLGPKLAMIGVEVMRAAQPEFEAKMEKLVEDYLAKQAGPGSDRS